MSSQGVSIIAALMIFGALALLAIGYQKSRARAATPEMESRLDRFGGAMEEETNDPSGRPTAMMTEAIDKAVKGKSFAEKWREALARADLRMTVGEFLALRAGAAVAGFLILMLIGFRAAAGLGLVFGVLGAIVGWMVPQLYINMRASRRRKRFLNQLGDTIGLMANSLRAGYSLLQTMELVSREAPSPMCDEFRRVVREVGLGVSPQQALNNLMRRVPSEDLDLMVSAINIQHEIGGNLGQILDVIGETIRERVRIQGEIQTLTAQQQLSGNIITAMPVVLALGLFIMNPDYMGGILVWPWICIPIGASILLIIGYFVMRKIVAIEV